MQKNISRKTWVLGILAFIVVGLIAWIIWTNTHIETTAITIQNGKIPASFQGYKIAEVADLHNHDWHGKLTQKLRKEAPDLIVITGDLVDSSHTDFDIAMEFINSAMEIAPVYYVTGNHEAWLGNYGELEKRMQNAGVHMMDDRNLLITHGNDSVNLIGIQDPDFTERGAFSGIQEAMVTTKLQPLLQENAYNIVLCHRPELFDGYVETGADLVITGHAHGGQIRIPFVGGLIAPNQGFFPTYTEGVYHRNATDMVVSRGLGNSVLPVRINNTPELVIITLETGSSGQS